ESKMTKKERTKDAGVEHILLSLDKTDYLWSVFSDAIAKYLPNIQVTSDMTILKNNRDSKIFHYGDYELLDFDQILENKRYLICSYIYRKALIRKNYLNLTTHSYIVKNPDSILKKAIPETYNLEIDYAEFLDEALDDSYELRDEINLGLKTWILKPSMSDKGQGIRIFKTINELQEIFNSFEEDEDEDEDEDDEESDNNGVITSQLRHFVVQRYLTLPLLLKSYNNRKFHIRTYVLCQGALKIYVYRRMLMLFSSKPFDVDDSDLSSHLTNTCFQNGIVDSIGSGEGNDNDNDNSDKLVEEFWKMDDLELSKEKKDKIFNQILNIVEELFRAALNVNRLNFQPILNAFEFFGLDFLIDEEFNVMLLEVNSYPDFKQTGDDLKDLINGLIEGLFIKVIVPFFSNEKAKEMGDSGDTSDLIKVYDEPIYGNF
ncbi:TTL-domain-containing protein, partial [Ascoidea rubescens DSM 1968]